MRLYQRALLKEMTATSGIALGVLSAILVVTLSVRILGTAALGQFDVSAVIPFISFGYLRLLPILLSLALFAGVLLTLARYWQDSEMVIWSGAGLPPIAWVTPILRFAGPITLIIASLSLAVIPWVSRQKVEYESYVTHQKQENTRLTPGVFAETGQGNRVYFIEDVKEDNPSVGNIFIQSEQNGRIGIVVANQGNVEPMPNSDHFLVLQKGRRYEGTPGNADYRVMEFSHYGFRLDPAQLAQRTAQPRELSTVELLRNPTSINQAELVWRMGYPLSALILALFAIPLSVYNPRVGRSFNILMAALIYTLYNNVMGLSQTWVSRGLMNAWLSQFMVHGIAFAALAAAFWWRYGRPLGRRQS
jgi:lipopolysaccharide export system permease protein